MDNSLIYALWFGILTSISPCPLATNIAALSFISKHLKNPKTTFLSGISYTIGRMLAYSLVTYIIVKLSHSIPKVSKFLSNDMNKVLGFVLLIVGMFLVDLFEFNFNVGLNSEKMQKLAKNGNFFTSLIIGFLFALSFCPISAALFFGSLIPIAIKENSNFIIPFSYGIGTSLIVFIFAIVMVYSTKKVGVLYNKLTKNEKILRYITGIIFIIVGIYLILKYVLMLI